MAVLFPFEVYTPYRPFFSGSVEAIALTLVDGEAAVYANHAPFTAPVTPCVLRIRDKDGNWRIAFTAEGILEVTSRKAILVSDAAEWSEEIDIARAQKAKEQAEEVLERAMFRFETESSAASLRRANTRIKVKNIKKQETSNI